jgi:uncharacterized protein
MIPFIGRKSQLEKLNLLLNKKTATLAVVKGRRRIGKSRLIEEFAQGHRFLEFAGLFPEHGITAQTQRDVFAQRCSVYAKLPPLHGITDWTDLFQILASITREGRHIILLDEITWMAMDDPTFLGKFKNIWDLELKKNPKLIVILCGSVSVWIEKNILSSTGYFGRVPVVISLEELSLHECNQLLEAQQFVGTSYEKFQLLAITGGIPYYLEQLQPGFNATQNIRNLCFTENALFVNEFDLIFHDIFESKNEMYKKIVIQLSNGSMEYNELCKALKYAKSGRLSQYLNELLMAGFISRALTWNLKNGKTARLSKYRLSDNYLRFYLKYIASKRELINQGLYREIDFMSLPGWYSVMGYQFENLVLKNRKQIFKILGIDPAHIVANNPFFQRTTVKQKSCQIDFLIQTRFNTLYVCEIKFSKNAISIDVIESVQEKIKHLAKPRGFSCFPVLIHVNGVNDAVIDQGYFIQIIDLSELLS